MRNKFTQKIGSLRFPTQVPCLQFSDSPLSRSIFLHVGPSCTSSVLLRGMAKLLHSYLSSSFDWTATTWNFLFRFQWTEESWWPDSTLPFFTLLNKKLLILLTAQYRSRLGSRQFEVESVLIGCQTSMACFEHLKQKEALPASCQLNLIPCCTFRRNRKVFDVEYGFKY